MYGVRFLLWLLAVVGWLNASEFPERECCDLEYPPPQSTTTTTSSTVATSTGSGRPEIVGFDDISIRTKEKRTKSFRKTISTAELSFAAISSVKASEEGITAKVIKGATQKR
ncbi:hypothetical protein Trydic_g18577 [Trypoxylus dichotomus]